MPTVYQLPYLAPIPRGHDVLVVKFALENKTGTLVLDRTTSTLYSPDELWGALHQDPALAVTDPIAVVTRWAWTVEKTLEGVSGGAMLSTRSWNERREMTTLLVVEPPGTPYR